MKVGNKTLSPRDMQVLCVVAGLIVLLLVYFVVYSNFREKNDALEQELNTRSQYLTELKGYYDNLPVYQKGTADAKVNIAKNLNKLPRGIKTEDFLLYMVQLHKDLNLDMNNISFNTDEMISNFETVIDDKQTSVNGYRTSVTTSARMTYEQFKEYLDYLYVNTEEITFLNSVSMSYDPSNAELNTSMNLSKYYIGYENAEYKPVPASDVPMGVENLFGTRS